MDILIDPEKSADALALAASVAKEKSPLAFLSGLCLETEGSSHVRASATDAEVSVTATLIAQVREAGRACVNAKSLMEVIRRSEGRAANLTAGDQGRVNCVLGQSRYQLGLISAEEMPAITVNPKSKILEAPVSLLAPMIADVKAAAGADANRYILDSVLLERKGNMLLTVATDGRRLATREQPLPAAGKDFSFPIPSAAVRVLERAFALAAEDEVVTVFFDGEKMGFHVGAVQVTARALEGEYPAWRDAVPKDAEASFFAVNADKLRGALEGLLRVVGDPAEVHLSRRGESTLKLSTEGRLNAGEEIIETAAPLGALPALSVNGRYLLEAVQPTRGKLVRLGVIRADRPLLVRAMDDSAYRAVIMPILTSQDKKKKDPSSAVPVS